MVFKPYFLNNKVPGPSGFFLSLMVIKQEATPSPKVRGGLKQ